MGRNDYKRFVSTCHKGINQQDDLGTLEQASDARNVWAPAGRVEQRPGYVCITGAEPTEEQGTLERATFVGGVAIMESPIGTFTTTNVLTGLAINERWYIGYSSLNVASSATSGYKGLWIQLTTPNITSLRAYVEYWNGTTWAPIYAPEVDEDDISVPHLNGDGHNRAFFRFAPPGDIAQTTVGTETKYFYRFTLCYTNADSALGATEINPANSGIQLTDIGTNIYKLYCTDIFLIQFPYSRFFIKQRPNRVNS